MCVSVHESVGEGALAHTNQVLLPDGACPQKHLGVAVSHLLQRLPWRDVRTCPHEHLDHLHLGNELLCKKAAQRFTILSHNTSTTHSTGSSAG